jgi:hypothetical protein
MEVRQHRSARTATKPRSRPQRKPLPEELPRELITHLGGLEDFPFKSLRNIRSRMRFLHLFEGRDLFH